MFHHFLRICIPVRFFHLRSHYSFRFCFVFVTLLMAANLRRQGLVSVGRIYTGDLRVASRVFTPRRREWHSSVYDKNVEDSSMCPTVVPDHVIQPHSDKYWVPNPTTGVFGPDHQPTAREGPMTQGTVRADGSVLEQQVWFRHLEDIDKPQYTSDWW